jgi:hypothetical protein
MMAEVKGDRNKDIALTCYLRAKRSETLLLRRCHKIVKYKSVKFADFFFTNVKKPENKFQAELAARAKYVWEERDGERERERERRKTREIEIGREEAMFAMHKAITLTARALRCA